MVPVGVSSNELIRSAENSLKDQFERIDSIAFVNQKRVLEAYRNHRLSETHFAEYTGYAIDDAGREVLDAIFADCMFSELAAVRVQLVSGTHALACALFGNLKPGDRLAILTGTPYDTLTKVIGQATPHSGSLKEMKVDYIEVDLFLENLDPKARAEELTRALLPPTTVAYIQKSCGYSFIRRSISNKQISALCEEIRKIRPDIKILVDNCYGEFVEEHEPPACGADLIAGSLIKNPGGGLAVSGGYLAGKTQLVEAALDRMTAPGIGGRQGALFNQGRLLFQGLFFAPSVVANAVKGAVLVAQVFTELGLNVKPSPKEARYDIIQALELKSPEALIRFCRIVQAASPVNAYVVPEPAEMPGYEDKVIMAGGTFVEGSTIELSADGPLRTPYVAYFQGGLSYIHTKVMIEQVVDAFRENRGTSKNIC
jgi:cystathionine beta-lyase family protein involved in aluminum resistance